MRLLEHRIARERDDRLVQGMVLAEILVATPCPMMLLDTLLKSPQPRQVERGHALGGKLGGHPLEAA